MNSTAAIAPPAINTLQQIQRQNLNNGIAAASTSLPTILTNNNIRILSEKKRFENKQARRAWERGLSRILSIPTTRGGKARKTRKARKSARRSRRSV